MRSRPGAEAGCRSRHEVPSLRSAPRTWKLTSWFFASAPPQYTQQWFAEKTALLERAIQLDPDYARALQEDAWHKLVGWIFRLDTSLPPEEIRQNAINAVQLDPNDGLAHRTAAFGYLYDRQLDLFEREAQLAFELAPYDADVFAQLGMAIAMSGQWDRGISLVDKAHRLNPVSAAGWYETALHYDYYRRGEYRKAVEVLRSHPGQMLCQTQFKYVAAYGQLGEPLEAKKHWDRCIASVANFSPGRVAELLRVWNLPESFIRHYMEGIGKAGYPCDDECRL